MRHVQLNRSFLLSLTFQASFAQAFTASWTVLFVMMNEQFEERLHCLCIQGIDLLFLLSFLENESTPF
jgi:hypothetical protein